MKTFLVVLVAFALSTTACGVCTVQATRCHGQESQVCDSRGRWQTVMDCDDVQGDAVFSCQQDEEEDHTCLPSEVGE